MEGNEQFGQSKSTMFCKVGGAANALSLSRDNLRLVVAGRSLLKIFSIDENTCLFQEVKNLHVGRKQGLNMSSSDVTWCPNDENIIATAATNGAVVVWDLTATTRNKQLVVFAEHRRTVTKVSFHPIEITRLLSGSQDGSMKMFDFRKKECSNTFVSKADGVRSVQFSPFNHFQFAASFDNGNVQIWDYRRGSTFMTQFIAHKGSVYTLDWHPDADEKNTIATGGRDNMVKVWDISHSRVKETGNIPTTSSVASVHWRPNRRDQLATASMMLDFSINVWDLRRKYVPFAFFDVHCNIPTGIQWKNHDPSVMFSCSKDGVLYLHTMREAVRPGDNTETRGFSMSSLGYICHAHEMSNSYSPRSQSPTGYPRLPGLFNWKTSSTFQMNDMDDLHGPALVSSAKLNKFLNAHSNLTISCGTIVDQTSCKDLNDRLKPIDTVNQHIFMKDFQFAAKNYQLNGPECKLTLCELCKHNSDVALKAGMSNVARTWLLLSEFYGACCETSSPMKSSNPSGTPIPRTHSDVTFEKNKRTDADRKRLSLNARKDEVQGSQVFPPSASGAESEIHSDDGRMMEDYLTDIARGRHSEPDFYFSEDDATHSNGYDGATSEADLLTDPELGAMRVPSEAFFQKEILDADSIAKFGHVDAPSAVINESATKRTVFTPHGGRWHETSVPTREENSPPPADTDEPLLSDKELAVKPSLWPDPLEAIRDSLTCEQLKWFAEKNDVQTPVCILLALSSYAILNNLPLNDIDVEYWQVSYMNLLAKHHLWVQHAQVIKMSKIPSIRSLSSSCTVQVSCRVCQRRMPSNNSLCDRSSDDEHDIKLISCFFCNLAVNGMYTYCQGCSFGGHFECVEKWLLQKKQRRNCVAHFL